MTHSLSCLCADRNGKIDKKEFHMSACPTFVFTVLDADGDGRVTRNEYEAGINLLDTDGDGVITREEFNCASGAPLAMLDKDSDGTVSRAEWNAGFVSFDTDDNGYTTAKKFSAVAHQDFVFDALDRDVDGKIVPHR